MQNDSPRSARSWPDEKRNYYSDQMKMTQSAGRRGREEGSSRGIRLAQNPHAPTRVRLQLGQHVVHALLLTLGQKLLHLDDVHPGLGRQQLRLVHAF